MRIIRHIVIYGITIASVSFSQSLYAENSITGLSFIPSIEAKHGPQGTGNYKGKRDRHEKPTPRNEKKKKSGKWLKLKK